MRQCGIDFRIERELGDQLQDFLCSRGWRAAACLADHLPVFPIVRGVIKLVAYLLPNRSASALSLIE